MKIVNWFKESNRWKHFAGGLVIGASSDSNYCAALLSLVAAGCLECKDKAWGGEWDWVDFALTVAGGVVGRGARVVIELVL